MTAKTWLPWLHHCGRTRHEDLKTRTDKFKEKLVILVVIT